MTTDFDAWEFRTRVALAQRNVDYRTADPLVADARVHWLAAGVPPEQALGSPEDFANEAAAQQRPGHDAGLDRSGGTPRSHLGNSAFLIAVMAMPYSLLGAVVAGSWTFELTPARVAGAMLFVLVAMVLFGGPESLRAAGRPELAPWSLAAATGAMALSVAALEALPRSPSTTLPVGFLTLAGAVAALALVWRPSPPRTEPPDATGTDPEKWLQHLAGLLVGRHDVTPKRAVEMVSETQMHAGTTDLGAEFGAAETYAAELASGVVERRQPRWLGLRKPLFLLFCLVLARSHIPDVLADGGGWRAFSFFVLAGAGLFLVALTLYRRGGRPNPEGPAVTG